MSIMVKILKQYSEVALFRKKNIGRSMAFVPTMGNLHEGHLSLMKMAQKKADMVIISIFVNPTQFGVNEDLDSYPRTFEKDIEKLNAIGVDALFFPSVEEIYPLGIENSISIELPEKITRILCGIQRPTHFQGVATVVKKLLQIVSPNVAIFGEKDFQQLAIIRYLVREVFIHTQIYGGSIIREKNGLAMSSRNKYLSDEEFSRASELFQTLAWCKDEIYAGKNISKVLNQGKQRLNNAGASVEYLDFRNIDSLALFPEPERGILLVAAYFGKTRLIDNLRMLAV